MTDKFLNFIININIILLIIIMVLYGAISIFAVNQMIPLELAVFGLLSLTGFCTFLILK